MTQTQSNEVLDDWKQKAEQYQVAKSIAIELEKSLKPSGFYNIPELLDKRRLEYGIPNGAFESYPGFDKVYLYQIPLPGQGGEHYSKGGSILKPETVQSWERNTAPRGIIVAAGLQALDSLHSSGFELGHIVRFKKMSPFIMPVAEIKGKWLSVYVIRDGDIEASEDLASKLNNREITIKNVSKDGYDWRIADKDGNVSGLKTSPYYDPSM